MSNYTQLGFVKQTDGENEGTWGDVLNENLIDLLDDAIGGYVEVSVASGNVTLAFADGTADNNGRHAVIKFTGSPGTTRTVTFPDAQVNYLIINGSDGSVICTSGSGAATVTIPTGMKDIIYVDGSDEILSMLATPNLTASADLTLDAADDIHLDAAGNTWKFITNTTLRAYLESNDGQMELTLEGSNKDFLIKGSDGGSAITALTLDMSEAGAATFNNKVTATELDISGNMDIDGTSNLDIVDIDGAVQIDATFTSGVDGQGYDTKFFGDTSSAYILWDTSEDKLLTAGGALVDIVKDKLMIGGTAVTTTAAELNLLDTASANSVVNSKAVIYGSSGELAGTLSTAAQGSVTSLGTLTALTVDDVAINGKVVTMTGSASDTAVFTAGTNGTLDITTTDAAAAAANIQITADGTAELAGTTVTLDSAADIELEATDDINIPSNVGLTFGNDGEKIEGDGSDLTISGNTVNLDSSMNHTFSSTGKAMVLGF